MDQSPDSCKEPNKLLESLNDLEAQLSQTNAATSIYLFYQFMMFCLEGIVFASYQGYEWDYQKVIAVLMLIYLIGLYGLVNSYSHLKRQLMSIHGYINLYSSIMGVSLVLVTGGVPISSVFFLLSLLLVSRFKKENEEMPCRQILFQFFFILLRLDGWLNIPWIILLFQNLLIFSYSIKLIYDFSIEIEVAIRSGGHQAFVIKDRFLIISLYLAFVQNFIFSVVVLNWTTFNLSAAVVLQAALVFNAAHLTFFALFKKQLAYALIKQEWKLVFRLSQNHFSERFHRGVDPDTPFGDEFCNKCALKPANILIKPCDHLTVCADCIKKCEKCPICGNDGSRHELIQWADRWQGLAQRYKIKFYRSNEFKSYLNTHDFEQ